MREHDFGSFLASSVSRPLFGALLIGLVLGVACFGDDEATPTASPSATASATPAASPTPDAPDGAQPAAAEVIERMAGILGVSADLIEVTAIEAVDWVDSCLEVARPGVACAAGTTPGFRIIVEFFDDTAYELRSDASLDRLIWNAPSEAEGEIETIDGGLSLITIVGSGPPFDDALTPGMIQLALLPGTEFLTALADLEAGERVRVGHAPRPASEVGALVWIASRSGGTLAPWLETVEARDRSAIAEAFQAQRLPCTLELGEGGPPKCWTFPEVPQEEESEVAAFEVYGCALSWVDADGLEAELGELAPRLVRYAAFEAGADYQPGGRFRDAAAQASIRTVAVFDGAAAFGFDGDGIVAVWRGCGAGESPSSFIPSGQMDFLLPPFPALLVNARPLGTGIPELDVIIAEVESQDVAALEARVSLEVLGCSNGVGAGGPPRCADDESEGTEVEVLRFLACEPEWHRASTMADVLDTALEHRPRRYAAFESGSGGPFAGSGTVLVFDGPDLRVGEPPWRRGMALRVVGDRIAEIALACGAGSGAEAMLPEPATSYLLDPPPRIAVAPSSGGCENALTISGRGFAPEAQVGLVLQSSRDNFAVLDQADADQAGEVTFQLASFPIGVDCDGPVTLFRASLLGGDEGLLPAYAAYALED